MCYICTKLLICYDIVTVREFICWIDTNEPFVIHVVPEWFKYTIWNELIFCSAKRLAIYAVNIWVAAGVCLYTAHPVGRKCVIHAIAVHNLTLHYTWAIHKGMQLNYGHMIIINVCLFLLCPVIFCFTVQLINPKAIAKRLYKNVLRCKHGEAQS